MTEKTITIQIVVRESVLFSWARDASTFVLFCALIGIGVYVESSAMQWVGALIGFMTVLAKAYSKVLRLTVDEAAAHIETLKGEKQ